MSKTLPMPGSQISNTQPAREQGITSVKRAEFMRRLFPEGVPPLWCPLLTHYTPEGAIDKTRIAAHCHHLSPYVKGFLIPGSTSDGWELNDDEFWQLLEIALELT